MIALADTTPPGTPPPSGPPTGPTHPTPTGPDRKQVGMTQPWPQPMPLPPQPNPPDPKYGPVAAAASSPVVADADAEESWPFDSVDGSAAGAPTVASPPVGAPVIPSLDAFHFVLINEAVRGGWVA